MLIEELKKEFKDKKYKIIDQKERLAAVLVPLIKRGGEFEILFTKRHNGLPTHAGEVSFPGGLMEEGDIDLSETAIRETYEELGIPKELIELIGRLDDEISIHKFKVAPFLGYIKVENIDISSLKYQTAEVEKIFSVPIKYFFSCPSWTETWVRKNDTVTVHFYPYKDVVIWGLTGRILSKLLSVFSKYFN
jgi:8-oxo-dGTP pyrophosphatase MutT (NUDIX family)